MKLSEYIQKLKDMQEEYGDLECEDSYANQIGDPEFIEGVFVLADKA